MTTLAGELIEAPEPSDAVPARRVPLRRVLARPAAALAVTVLVLTVLAAIFAPLLAPHDPVQQNLDQVGLRPWLLGGTFSHPLGTDNLGRDVLSRVLYGARTSLAIGLGCATVATIVGVILGTLAGYFEGAVGLVIRTAGNIEFAVPATAVGIALAAVLGPGLTTVLVVLTVWSWPISARTISSTVSQTRHRDYVAAARISGASPLQIFRRHLLRPVLGPAVVLWSTASGILIIAESGLSLIGLGVQDPRFSWGSMLADSDTLLRTEWWAVIFPGLAIAVTVLAFSVLGDVLRDLVNPRLGDRPRDPELW